MKHMAILGSQLEILEGFTRIRMSEEKQTREVSLRLGLTRNGYCDS